MNIGFKRFLSKYCKMLLKALQSGDSCPIAQQRRRGAPPGSAGSGCVQLNRAKWLKQGRKQNMLNWPSFASQAPGSGRNVTDSCDLLNPKYH